MKIVVQRVASAQVKSDGETLGEIGKGMLLLVGFGKDDSSDVLDWACSKLSKLRIYADDTGNMNKSILDVGGEVLVVSQFTLYASTKKGNRPSFIEAAPPEIAKGLYDEVLKRLEEIFGIRVKSGRFGADMQVSLINDGPVTIILDSGA